VGTGTGSKQHTGVPAGHTGQRTTAHCSTGQGTGCRAVGWSTHATCQHMQDEEDMQADVHARSRKQQEAKCSSFKLLLQITLRHQHEPLPAPEDQLPCACNAPQQKALHILYHSKRNRDNRDSSRRQLQQSSNSPTAARKAADGSVATKATSSQQAVEAAQCMQRAIR
jgi:hypothetical protein